MRRVRRLTGVLAIAFALGCGAVPPHFDVTGTVTLDGEPLASGDILFVAVDGSSADGGPIAGGIYKVRTMPGLKKVIIQASVLVEEPGLHGEAKTPRGIIPPRYNTETTLTATVAPRAGNQADFALVGR
jgi:hypothetical protein